MTLPHNPSASSSEADAATNDSSLAAFDGLIAALDRWSGSLPEWPPAKAVATEWQEVVPRLDQTRRELTRVLVVGVIGGTGTGKSTLVNALAGCDVSEAGDVARPTTVHPVVVASPTVDLSWLPVDVMGARVVRSDAPSVSSIVLIDCPDPDTQSAVDDSADHSAERGRPSATNRNRDLLRTVLPFCDVLLLVATAQKYKSWTVAREVEAFAPGRPLFFVQTHASRDPDIRADWRRELEGQGFTVPRIFRLDGRQAADRAAAGLVPEAGFAELVDAIDLELVGRAARRVRRLGAIDLTGWFVDRSRARLEPLEAAVAGLGEGVGGQRARLEKVLSAAISASLHDQRRVWQRRVTDEIVERWSGGPFAMFLRILTALGSLWGRLRPGGGVIGRLLVGGPAAVSTGGPSGWQAVEELGLPEAEVEQSRSILAGLAARARTGDELVGRGRLDDERMRGLATTVLDRAGHWLATGIERMATTRRDRLAGPMFQGVFELLFSSLLMAVLVRAGWDFFHGQLWLGRPTAGGGFLLQALVWLVLWGLALRWLVFRIVRAGLDRDIATLVAGLPQARLIDPLLADYERAAERMGMFLSEGRRLAEESDRLSGDLAREPSDLGRLRAHRHDVAARPPATSPN
jgi:energy-coupling factor transporter ATP-binding protein EcfA2